jgi:hypothetical protein
MLDLLKKGIAPFICTVEEISLAGITFLDLEVRKGPHWRATGFLDYEPFIKETSLQTMLGFNSAHPLRIHRAYLAAYFKRLWRHSCSHAVYERARAEILLRLHRAGIDPLAIVWCSTHSSFHCKFDVPFGLYRLQPAQERKMWLRLPFHPLWADACKEALREFCKTPHLKCIMQEFLGLDLFAFAFELKLPSLLSMTRRGWV